MINLSSSNSAPSDESGWVKLSRWWTVTESMGNSPTIDGELMFNDCLIHVWEMMQFMVNSCLTVRDLIDNDGCAASKTLRSKLRRCPRRCSREGAGLWSCVARSLHVPVMERPICNFHGIWVQFRCSWTQKIWYETQPTSIWPAAAGYCWPLRCSQLLVIEKASLLAGHCWARLCWTQ